MISDKNTLSSKILRPKIFRKIILKQVHPSIQVSKVLEILILTYRLLCHVILPSQLNLNVENQVNMQYFVLDPYFLPL